MVPVLHHRKITIKLFRKGYMEFGILAIRTDSTLRGTMFVSQVYSWKLVRLCFGLLSTICAGSANNVAFSCSPRIRNTNQLSWPWKWISCMSHESFKVILKFDYKTILLLPLNRTDWSSREVWHLCSSPGQLKDLPVFLGKNSWTFPRLEHDCFVSNNL